MGVLLLLLSPILSGSAPGIVMDSRIKEVPGLRFENVIYNLEHMFVDIVNMTDRNILFGGTMIFVDRYGTPVASARLLPKKVERNAVKRYTGYFIEGSGEMARRAARVIWDFGAR